MLPVPDLPSRTLIKILSRSLNMYVVTCMLFVCLYFDYLVSVDPDIGDIDGK